MQGSTTTRLLSLVPSKSRRDIRQSEMNLFFCFKIYVLLYVLDRDLMVL